MPKLVGLLVPELPGCPRFSILGITFPLTGLVRILLRNEDGFRCRSEKSGVGEREVGAERLALGVLKHVDVDGHDRGVCVVSLDDEREVNGVNDMESRAALFNMCEKSGGKDISIKRGGVMQLADPHVVDDGKDEGGGAADACVVESLILDADLPDGLKFPGLFNGVLQDGGISTNALGRGERLSVL